MEDFLPALRQHGLDFETVSPQDWLAALRGKEHDPKQVPAVKLMSWWESKFRDEEAKAQEGGRSSRNNGGGQELVFATEAAERGSSALREAPNVIEVGLVGKFLDYWQGLDED